MGDAGDGKKAKGQQEKTSRSSTSRRSRRISHLPEPPTEREGRIETIHRQARISLTTFAEEGYPEAAPLRLAANLLTEAIEAVRDTNTNLAFQFLNAARITLREADTFSTVTILIRKADPVQMALRRSLSSLFQIAGKIENTIGSDCGEAHTEIEDELVNLLYSFTALRSVAALVND